MHKICDKWIKALMLSYILEYAIKNIQAKAENRIRNVCQALMTEVTRQKKISS